VAQNDTATVTQGWKPECGFLHYGWEGYTEALILYTLGLGSPAYPLPSRVWRVEIDLQWENCMDTITSMPGRSLFISSHTLDRLQGIRDRFMRAKRSDYFENSGRPPDPAGVCAEKSRDIVVTAKTAGFYRLRRTGAKDPIHQWHRSAFLWVCCARVPYGPDDGTFHRRRFLARFRLRPKFVCPRYKTFANAIRESRKHIGCERPESNVCHR